MTRARCSRRLAATADLTPALQGSRGGAWGVLREGKVEARLCGQARARGGRGGSVARVQNVRSGHAQSMHAMRSTKC